MRAEPGHHRGGRGEEPVRGRPEVLRNTDEDTYLYIRVVTAATTSGTCFSRYDAIVYSYTAATMSYGSRPALVQVSSCSTGAA